MRFLSVLILCAAAAAQEAPFVPTGLDMLPGLEPAERQKMKQAAAPTFRKIQQHSQHIQKLEGQIRKRPGREQVQKLQGLIAQTRKRVAEFFRAMEQDLKNAGLDDAGLERLKRMPRGALREERYNHRVLLEASNLSQRQEALLERLVAATDGAQRVLLSQERRARNNVKEIDKTIANQILGDFGRQRYEIERRFWTAAYYAMKPEQMAEVRKLFSPRYAYYNNVQGHLYLLPGITPSQAMRIKASFTECESEVAADRAQINQIRAQLRDKGLPQKDRGALYKRQGECQKRIQECNTALRDHLRATITEEQRAVLHSVAPRLNPGDLGKHPGQLVRGMSVRPEQDERLKKLGRDIQREAGKIRRLAGKKVGAMSGDFGPESPQAMTMQTMQQNAQSEVIAAYRTAAHDAIVEVLDPEQVSGWVIAPDTK